MQPLLRRVRSWRSEEAGQSVKQRVHEQLEGHRWAARQHGVLAVRGSVDTECLLLLDAQGAQGFGYCGEDAVKVRPELVVRVLALRRELAEIIGHPAFVALELYIDNWRWADVPFYLRTGKMLPKRETEVTIQFKRPPFVLFRDTPVETLAPNQLVIHIQPDEGISLSFSAKIPGPQLRLGNVNMRFDYNDYFREQSNTGYERLLYDAMLGDATLFQRADMVEAAWYVVQPILDVWKALPPRRFPNYAAGTWGPVDAEELMSRRGRDWRNGD